MQKIMFNDKYGLTQAVLVGRKTMTRRIIDAPSNSIYTKPVLDLCGNIIKVYALDPDGRGLGVFYPKYRVGEVVAVAQNLRDMGYDPRDTKHKPGAIWGLDHSPAWTNKMFVSASECIHQIRITNVSVERLRDISDEDCLREGVMAESIFDDNDYCIVPGIQSRFTSPRGAFAALIDKVSGKGTFGNNPWVFVYEFELVK